MIDPLTGQWEWVHVGTGILTPHLDAIKRSDTEYKNTLPREALEAAYTEGESGESTKSNSAEPGAGSAVTGGVE